MLESHGSYFVEDLRSRNGTYLNGKLLDGRTQLKDGDQIRISDVLLSFLENPSSLPGTETHSDVDLQSDPDLTPGVLTVANPRGLNTVDDESGIFVLPESYQAPPFDSQDDLEVVKEIDSQSSDGESGTVVRAEDKLRAMLQIARGLGGELRVDKVLPTVLEKLFETFPQAEQGFILMKDEESGRLKVMATKSRTATSKGEAVVVSMTVVKEAMTSGKALLSTNVRKDERFRKSSSLARMKIRSMMCVPLLDHDGKSIGVIQMVTRASKSSFTEEDLDMLNAVATQAGLAIENARMHEALVEQRDLERDLEFATQVQLGFLPKAKPRAPQYRFADYYEAALRVGGDYFDYVSLPDGRIAVAIGDVAGKGVPAALLMARLYSSTRFQLLTAPTPAEAIDGLNAEIASSGLGHRFITFLVIVLDPVKHEITVVNAGHPPPLQRLKSGEVLRLGTEISSLPLGIMPEQTYESATYPMPAGSLILTFTDGVTEAMSADREIYGRQRLMEYVKSTDKPIDEFLKGLVEDVEEFGGAGPLRDDTCVVGFERLAT